MPSSSSRDSKSHSSRSKSKLPERDSGKQEGDYENFEWGDEYGNTTRGATGDFGLRSEHARYKDLYPKRPGGAKKRDGWAPPGWGDEYGNPDRGALGDFGTTGWDDDNIGMGDFGLRADYPKYKHLYPERPGGTKKRDGFAPPGWGDEYGNPDLGCLGDFGTTGWGDDDMKDFGLSGWGEDDMKNFGSSGLSDYHSEETKKDRAKKRHIAGIEVTKHR